jgi:hypothetical protein
MNHSGTCIHEMNTDDPSLILSYLGISPWYCSLRFQAFDIERFAHLLHFLTHSFCNLASVLIVLSLFILNNTPTSPFVSLSPFGFYHLYPLHNM